MFASRGAHRENFLKNDPPIVRRFPHMGSRRGVDKHKKTPSEVFQRRCVDVWSLLKAM